MVLKKKTRRLKQFPTSIFRSDYFDQYCVGPFTAVPRFLRISLDNGEDIRQVQEYLVLTASDNDFSLAEQLSPAHGGSKSAM